MPHLPSKSRNHQTGRGVVAATALIFAVAASQFGVGCKKETDPLGPVGQGGEGGGTNLDKLSAEQFYIDVVHPEIDATCGVCHQSADGCVPKFMGDSAEKSYAELNNTEGMVTHADNSNLIYHGAHTGPALTEFQESLIRTWLDKEFKNEDAPKPTLSEALVDVGRCMKEQQFIDSELYLLAYQQSEHGPCGSCHRTGEAGTWIGYNEEEMFLKNSQLPWIKRLVKPAYDENNVFVDLVPSNRFVVKVGEANACGSSHPAALVGVDMQDAIQTYVEESLANWHNDNCEQP